MASSGAALGLVGERGERMKRMRMLVVAALAASTVVVAAPPAQARCLPEYAIVCQAIVTVCKVTGRHCAA